MATIGSFTRKPDGSYEGSLATLTIQVRLRLVPLEDRPPARRPTTASTPAGSSSGQRGPGRPRRVPPT
jgi:uncharacterized protein (DUF736 family)